MMIPNDNIYSGSRILQPVSDVIGLPVDQINLISAELFGLSFAFVFRSQFHITKVSQRTRHLVSFIIGVLLCVFCFGHEVWHLFLQVGVGYILMHVAPPNAVHLTVFMWSMGYLSFKHIYRMIYDYGGYVLDVTGPIMLTTQKLCSVAFSYHDGRYKRDEELSTDQRNQCIRQVPNPLEFFSYVFCFQGLLCGPLIFYKDYDDFISGNNFKSNDNKKERYYEPSPNAIIAKKLAFCALSTLVTLTIMPHFLVSKNVDPVFMQNHHISVRAMYLIISIFCLRFKYYFAWMLSETVCHASGIGFNGYDEKGNAKWDLVDNVNVVSIETSTSIKVFIDHWNMQTNRWLRRIAYNRLGIRITLLRVLMTTMLSSAWHGYYPGYFFAFLQMTMFVIAARKVRRVVRPLMLTSPRRKFAYDVVTWTASQLSMSYLMVPFVLLEFYKIVSFYSNMYWFMHIGVLIVHLIPIAETPSPSPSSLKTVPISTNHQSVPVSTNHKAVPLSTSGKTVTNSTNGNPVPLSTHHKVE